jgi:hypothetical protein
MLIEGSCHCGKVRYRANSKHPAPYMRCYCSICRKAGGGSGYSINTEVDTDSFQVEGKEHVKIFQAMIERDGKLEQSKHQRHFCGECGCHLWAFHPNWPELIHPVAGSIDTPLQAPPEYVHIMLGSKAPWVEVEGKPGDPRFDQYPEKSIAAWHDEHALTGD